MKRKTKKDTVEVSSACDAMPEIFNLVKVWPETPTFHKRFVQACTTYTLAKKVYENCNHPIDTRSTTYGLIKLRNYLNGLDLGKAGNNKNTKENNR